MSLSDRLFYNAFNCYKNNSKKRARLIAVVYITFFQMSILLLLGVFLATFFNQMNTHIMSSEKAWTLFFILIPILYFKNWIQYSGRKGKIINAQMNKGKTLNFNSWMLWLLPIVIVGLSVFLLKIF